MEEWEASFAEKSLRRQKRRFRTKLIKLTLVLAGGIVIFLLAVLISAFEMNN